MRCLYRYNYESLCAIALIQNDTPTSKMKPFNKCFSLNNAQETNINRRHQLSFLYF